MRVNLKQSSQQLFVYCFFYYKFLIFIQQRKMFLVSLSNPRFGKVFRCTDRAEGPSLFQQVSITPHISKHCNQTLQPNLVIRTNTPVQPLHKRQHK